MISAGIFVALALGIASLFRRPDPTGSEGNSAGAATATAPSKVAPRGEKPAGQPVLSQVPQVPSAGSTAVVAAVLPGHEGHGDECAQCLAERKLAVYREDFAQLHFTQAAQCRAPTPEQATELLDACRVFSMSALREWSFSDAKPRLADDSTLEKLRSELLQPLIERLPAAADEAP